MKSAMKPPLKLRRADPGGNPVGDAILPLIDVVFFLLIFFMLVGRMDATAPFDVTPPQATIGKALPAGGATLVIASDGRIALDGLERERAAAVSELSEAIGASPELRIRVQADGAAPLRHVLPLVAELEAAGAKDIVLVVPPEAL